jgi:competence protein ComEA
MMRSLLIKLAMLAVTLGSLIWIGSVTPIRQVTPHHLQPATAAPAPSPVRQPTIDGSVVSPSAVAASGVSESALTHASPKEELTLSAPFGSSRPAIHDSPRVELNHATASDLEGLPGIGPKLAQRVIEHRASHGPFTKVEDLRHVKGIGHKKFDRLRPHVLVTGTKLPSRHKGAL